MTKPKVIPFCLKEAPALIETLLPVQKLSAESYKEQMSGSGKTLTALGSYWKGRKPLILNKACVLGCLLPATGDPGRDLEIFEKLMAMDDESFAARWPRSFKPKEILTTLTISRISDFFRVEPKGVLPEFSPVDWTDPTFSKVRVVWREDLPVLERRRLEAQMLPRASYRERIAGAKRPEEVADKVHDHIWDQVNSHLGTSAVSFPELVEQLGIMRFGRRPRVADTFCGSGQIPFEAARLGCDVYASDLNPVACMLTWGAFNIVGGSKKSRETLEKRQAEVVERVRAEIDAMGVETDGNGWRAKAYLYCVEARCPQTGWMVPLIPNLIVSKPRTGVKINVTVDLAPDYDRKRYDVSIRSGVSEKELNDAEKGTVQTEGRGSDPYMVHTVDGIEYRTRISTLRGDYRTLDRETGNRLSPWEIDDFMPRPGDIFQERLYAIQWMKQKEGSGRFDYEFRSVTEDDMARERRVEEFMASHLAEWQEMGWIPDMRIEPGYNTDQPIRERGWTHWHHLFNPRQLMIGGLVSKYSDVCGKFGLFRILNANCRLSRWDGVSGGGGCVQAIFDDQALNTLFNYGCRSSISATSVFEKKTKSSEIFENTITHVFPNEASSSHNKIDLFITDPPYGDAVKYEEILEFFIAWLRKNPPPEFSDWVWDSRRTLAIKGNGEDFRQGMVAAYGRMTECMADNGLQVIMFTHQSGGIWADMANIVWASGLQVTAAWYVVTETDSALREGRYVKGTILLVLQKRSGSLRTTRDDLAWEIQEEVENQVESLTGLNQKARPLYRDENLFEDADLQMAGYAAALRVLTRYSTINGRDMTREASRPRVKGEKTFVDELIDFAVETANGCLVPRGIGKGLWNKLCPAERFYMKMIGLEAKGLATLDNYQNFAKAFKVRDFSALMATTRANHARLKTAVEFGRAEMGEGSELCQTTLRAALYAMMELAREVDGAEVLAHMAFNLSDFYDQTRRDQIVAVADYMASNLEAKRPEEAGCARILRDLVRNQKL